MNPLTATDRSKLTAEHFRSFGDGHLPGLVGVEILSVSEKGVESRLPPGVVSVQEIILDGPDLSTLAAATQAAIHASKGVPGLERISAGNYNGKLGKSFVYLHPERQPVPTS